MKHELEWLLAEQRGGSGLEPVNVESPDSHLVVSVVPVEALVVGGQPFRNQSEVRRSATEGYRLPPLPGPVSNPRMRARPGAEAPVMSG